MKIVIVGGGAIGMMQARELALAGCEVVLLERHMCGREASWAGGGIISPLYPWRYSPPITALSTWSQEYYPNLVQSLEAESGIDPQLTRTGLLVLSIDDRERALAWSRDHQLWLEEVSSEQIYQLEPSLRSGFNEGMYMPQVGSIRNPRLCQALRAILLGLPNVELKENTEVLGIQQSKGQFECVKTQSEAIYADACIVTSGAWSGGLLESLQMCLPVEPVRGQMVAFQANPGDVSRIVLDHGKYVIPRRDGLVLAGSTLEYVGFDKSRTEEAKHELVDIARSMIPALAKAPVVEHWAGLRPGSPNGLPFIGELPNVERVFVNAGQFRNGLVLAPASVNLMTAIILGQEHVIDRSPYALEGRIGQEAELPAEDPVSL
ncbi:glycine oxidase ThiO [Hahella sp. CCB-MM4]|uniref:glycine oxidase ThiO n=1 Tax=Hahella sp. (strain CCB-MM4) TaxID=1926491 RepID=UPI000B9C6184|nr:glycine oxidase ThiO [Hahella sp. CCB-MM4]OZG71480.1 glycine oxidase ThiO [Hahella sp. CCB-MM4]